MSKLRALLGPQISRVLTSTGLRDSRRLLASLSRRVLGSPAQLHYFHQADDPYSQLLVQVLPTLLASYRVELRLHLVPAPDAAAAPDEARLQGWSRRDAARLAQAYGLSFDDIGRQPAAEHLAQAQQALLTALDGPAQMLHAQRVGAALWSGNQSVLEQLAGNATAEQVAAQVEQGAELRRRLGHYLGGTLYFESEWFWGLDRLPQLQQRLEAAGLARSAGVPPVVAQREVRCSAKPTNGTRPQLHFYCSLRSPYTYLAAARARRLAEHYGAELVLRPVKPMAMRGLPVPLSKRLYIVRDCKREAERLGLPFGLIADPLGAPTERGLAVLHHALNAGKGTAFLESFLTGVWSEGIDAGSDAGLALLASRAGLDQALVATALADDSWQARVESNRAQMFELGLWGVPSFQVDQRPAHWGQDRLWQIEQDLIEVTAAR